MPQSRRYWAMRSDDEPRSGLRVRRAANPPFHAMDPHRLKQFRHAEDIHHALHVIGQDMERHLCPHIAEPLREEVRRAHPELEGSEDDAPTVLRRTVIISGFRSSLSWAASRTASCSQRLMRRSLPVVHFSFSGQAEQTVVQ